MKTLRPFDKFVEDIRAGLDEVSASVTHANVVLGMESDSEALSQFETMSSDLDRVVGAAIEENPLALSSLSILSEDGSIGTESDVAGELAANASAMVVAGKESAPDLTKSITSNSEYDIVVGSWNKRGLSADVLGLESFDERDIAKLRTYTTVANLFAGFSTKFARALAPVYTTGPNEAGVSIVVNLLYIQQHKKHNIDGSLMNWGRRTLSHALIDSDILAPTSTDLVPVYRPGTNDDKFVDPADYNITTRPVGAETVETLPLKAGIESNVKGLSQTDALVAEGEMDWTDTIEPNTKLQTLFIKLPNASDVIIPLQVEQEISSQYLAGKNGDITDMVVNFASSTVLVTPTMADVKGNPLPAPLDVLAPGNGNYTVHLRVLGGGQLGTQSGNQFFDVSSITVYDIVDSNNQSIDKTAGDGLDIVNAFVDAELDGYFIKGKFSNLNLRHRVPHITTRGYRVNYICDIDSPINIYRPPSQINAFKDTSGDLEALVRTVAVRADNMVVDKLVEAANNLLAYGGASFSRESARPEVYGIGSIFTNVTFDSDSIDVSSIVNSVRSQDKYEDVMAVLADRLHTQATNVYEKSGLFAGIESIGPGFSTKPVYVIATSPKIAAVLDMSRHDNKYFTYEVVATQNKKLRDRAIGIFRFNQADQPHPLSWAFMGTAPSILFNNNAEIDGATVKVLSQIPRQDVHITNSIMASLVITGVEDSFTRRTPTPH